MTQPQPSSCRGGGDTRAELRLQRVEADAEGLCLTFAIRDAARALPNGALLDLQASDDDRAGTTGRPLVDELIAERVRRRLAHARAGAVLREFDRRRRAA